MDGYLTPTLHVFIRFCGYKWQVGHEWTKLDYFTSGTRVLTHTPRSDSHDFTEFYGICHMSMDTQETSMGHGRV